MRVGHWMTLAGLGFLALTLGSGLLLALEVALGPAVLAALLAVTSVLWVAVPLRLRRQDPAK